MDRPEDPVRVPAGQAGVRDESRGIVYLCGDKLISKVVESDRAQQNIDYLAQLVEKSAIPVYVAMIPTAAEIWRDQLRRAPHPWTSGPTWSR